MKVLFAPDYRAGNPYQRLLAEALQACGVRVVFAEGYRRVLPFTRLVRRHAPDLVHLHWPEAYFPRLRGAFDALRLARWPLDLALAARIAPVVLTAHNLTPHARTTDALLRRAMAATHTRPRRIIAHSPGAARAIGEAHPAAAGRIIVVPHGDLAAESPLPRSVADARTQLGLGDTRYCLAFGALEPYKGFEELIDWWHRHKPALPLWIIGRSWNPEFEQTLRTHASAGPGVRLILERPDDAALAAYLVGAETVIFNYRRCLTSGGAVFARSVGATVLLPARLDTIDLTEPHPSVHRFSNLEDDFARRLSEALAQTANRPWRDEMWRRLVGWPAVANQTATVYREALTRPLL